MEKDSRHVFHIYNIRHKEREIIRNHLLSNHIKTEIHYPVPPHRQKALIKYFNNGDYPITDEIHNTTLSLPISISNTVDEIEYIVKVLNEF